MTHYYAELFAGAGGLSRGLEAAGFHAQAHAEIEPHARAVLRYRWPDTRLDGDVTEINGADYAGITLLSGGSPCQDLSVAGKRAGLEGSRSSLFFEQVRIWNESGAPYLLWENVYGALSSNAGKDFAAVLSAIVGANVDVPLVRGKPKWQRAGRAVGPTAVAAWRVLDLQHFGPPQRRVRVFVLAARTGGVDPAEVLALSEGVCGHPSPRQQAREGTTGRTAGGVGAGGVMAFKAGQSEAAGGTFVTEGFTPTLQGGSNGSTQVPAVLAIGLDGEKNADIELIGCLNTGSKSGSGQQPAVVAFEPRYYTRDNKTGGAPSDLVKVDASIGKNGDAVPHVLAFHHTQTPISGDVAPSVGGTTNGMGVVVSRAGYQGWAEAEDSTGSLCARDGKDASTLVLAPVTPTLNMGAHTAAPGSNGQDAVAWATLTTQYAGRPRRLTPKECERLMAWPDDHTRYGVREDGTEYALSDTARYRLCGNGVGSTCAEWIGHRLMSAISRCDTL